MTKALRIRMLLDPARARTWHRHLAETLRQQGHSVEITLGTGPAISSAATLLLTLERLVYGANREGPGASWTIDKQSTAAGEVDLILDMTGSSHGSTTRTLTPLYAGSPFEEAAIAALLAERIPELGLHDSSDGTTRAFRAAVERPRVLCKALDNLGARLETILASAVADIAEGAPIRGERRAASAAQPAGLTQSFVHRARLALQSLASKPPHWFVGWRRAGTDHISQTLRLPSGWSRLTDDGARFYADPFVFQHAGRIWLFLEDFIYATGKALISVVELGPQGPIGMPRPIVERPYHLSYPFVFERDGAIWMIPEMSAARRVELLRATNFPFEWKTAATLLEGEEISDATLVEHQNRLWLFGTIGGHGASSWDALHLWSAPKLLGDWRPHAKNPVLIDAASARPAGAMFARGADLWRPAQDCTRGYGSALALARVTRLDDEAFVQEVAATLHPGENWPGIALHTLNSAGEFEVIDGASAGCT